MKAKALDFLNKYLEPWHFEGDEPIAVALVGVLEETPKTIEALIQRSVDDGICDDWVLKEVRHIINDR